VDCLLPKFDKETVERVVKALREGGGDAPPTGRILINPKEMKPNSAVPQTVWEKFVSLPSQTRPQRGAKPAIRLTALAHELASDGLLPAAGGKAHAAMHKVLDDFIAERAPAFAEKRAAVMTVEGRTSLPICRAERRATTGFKKTQMTSLSATPTAGPRASSAQTLRALTRWNGRNASRKPRATSTTR
jgi:type III restriction enzyme